MALRKKKPSRSTIGEPQVWLCGLGLALGIVMIVLLLGLITFKGAGVFWPKNIVVLTVGDSDVNAEAEAEAEAETDAGDQEPARQIAGEIVLKREKQNDRSRREWQLFVGNKDAHAENFVFLDEAHIRDQTYPEDILIAERMEYGDAIFFPVALKLKDGDEINARDPGFEDHLRALVREGNKRREEIRHLEKGKIGAINHRMRKLQLEIKKLDLKTSLSDETRAARKQSIETKLAALQESYNELAAQARVLRDEQKADQLVYRIIEGDERTLYTSNIVGFYAPNRLSFAGKVGVALSHLWSFLSDEPREANTEGGIFPAIFGTFVMTLIMTIVVTPFGVIAAIYLREYAKQGFLVRSVRISVNNLAGVPSIVFGVFGLGFFIYGIGAFIDGGPATPMPPAWWWPVSIGSIVTIFGAVLLSIHNTEQPGKPSAPRIFHLANTALWLVSICLVVLSIAKCPFFHGFFGTALPTPTFGTGGIFWASLTLALLTLPVVIVATEEALAAVPRGVREAALACGASKWQMIQRVVLPSATPGILTGIILSMARGAGEVAPLMLVGVVKLAPALPLDTVAPFIHPERKFMHLGFHIYDLGFQSPDSEAAKPMVFATTFLLILLVVVLNLGAIIIRNHLRKKYVTGAF